MRALIPQSSGFGLARFLPGAAFDFRRYAMKPMPAKPPRSSITHPPRFRSELASRQEALAHESARTTPKGKEVDP
jgi:hypothetical protein